MQKFPLRMKDNDLLVTELYHDPSNDIITAISVYLTPKTSKLVISKILKFHVTGISLSSTIYILLMNPTLFEFVSVCCDSEGSMAIHHKVTYIQRSLPFYAFIFHKTA